MVDFVAFFESAQNGDRVLDTWFVDHHRLKAPLQGSILLDVLSVLIQRGCADRPQFTPRKLGLEKIGSIH